MKEIKFQINNHDIRYLKILYSSIDINNIENYLKRIEIIENKKKIKISFIPNVYVYSVQQLQFATYITENRFIDKINVSDSFNTEMLLVISNARNQINKINNELYLLEGKGKNKEIFVLLLSEKEINKKDIELIKKELSLTVLPDKNINFNKKKALEFYKVKEPDAENKIIEMMALSLIDK